MLMHFASLVDAETTWQNGAYQFLPESVISEMIPHHMVRYQMAKNQNRMLFVVNINNTIPVPGQAQGLATQRAEIV